MSHNRNVNCQETVELRLILYYKGEFFMSTWKAIHYTQYEHLFMLRQRVVQKPIW